MVMVLCDDCGCEAVKAGKSIFPNLSVSMENDRIADGTSAALAGREILCINLLGAPGSGKTAVIEGLVERLPKEEIAVIEADLESDIDRERLKRKGIHSFQVNTHKGCHLNAMQVGRAVGVMALSGKKYLIIENVGNLVCPAGIKIGQHIDILVNSMAEGSDKPAKYPVIYMNAAAVILSKADLAPYVDFDEKKYLGAVRRLNPRALIFKTGHNETGQFRALADFISHRRDHLTGRPRGH